MKIYQFYSDYNDSHNVNMPDKIRDNDKPIPEKYRSKKLDLFITGIDELLTPYLNHYTAAQIWWSESKKDWRVYLLYSSDIKEIKLVKEKYYDTIKELDEFPHYMPNNLFSFLVECQFTEDWNDYKKLMNKYSVSYQTKAL